MVTYKGYKISKDGRVFNSKGKELKPWVHQSRNGYYLRVTICYNGKKKNYRVHRLVAMAYLPNPENKPEVHHIDDDTFNNRLENLQWVTRWENEMAKKKNKKSA